MNTTRGGLRPLPEIRRQALITAFRSVQVDAHAEVVIRLRLGADHRREVEDHVGIRRDRLVRQGGDVALQAADREIGIERARRIGEIESDQAGDFVAAQPAVAGEMGAELAAEKSGAAENGDLHVRPLCASVGVSSGG